jgi:preprotein translocase subunit SecE
VGVRIPPPLPAASGGFGAIGASSVRFQKEEKREMAEEQSLTQKATSWPGEIKDYFDELHMEMKRVTWPPWKQVRATTLVVIVAVFAFAAYFLVVDTLVGTGVDKLFKSFSH